MSLEDVQLVEALTAAAPDDMRALVESEHLQAAFAKLLDPEFEFVLAGRGGDVGLEQAMGIGGVYAGVEGWRKGMTEWLSAWETYSNVTEEVLDAGDAVVTLTRERGRPRSGGSEIAVETASVWRLRDGKVLRLEAYTDRPSALRAAGLEDKS